MFLDFSQLTSAAKQIASNASLRLLATYIGRATQAATEALGAPRNVIRDYNAVAQGYVDNGSYVDVTPDSLKPVANAAIFAASSNIRNAAEAMRGQIAGADSVTFTSEITALDIVSAARVIEAIGSGIVCASFGNYIIPKQFCDSMNGYAKTCAKFYIGSSQAPYFYEYPGLVTPVQRQASSDGYGLRVLGDRVLLLPGLKDETSDMKVSQIILSSGIASSDPHNLWIMPIKTKDIGFRITRSSTGQFEITEMWRYVGGHQISIDVNSDTPILLNTMESGSAAFYMNPGSTMGWPVTLGHIDPNMSGLIGIKNPTTPISSSLEHIVSPDNIEDLADLLEAASFS